VGPLLGRPDGDPLGDSELGGDEELGGVVDGPGLVEPVGGRDFLAAGVVH
jgi:hypothetical protein